MDDLLLNSLGCVMGYGLYLLIKLLFNRKKDFTSVMEIATPACGLVRNDT